MCFNPCTVEYHSLPFVTAVIVTYNRSGGGGVYHSLQGVIYLLAFLFYFVVDVSRSRCLGNEWVGASALETLYFGVREFFSHFLWLSTSILLLCFSGDRRDYRYDVGVVFFSS